MLRTRFWRTSGWLGIVLLSLGSDSPLGILRDGFETDRVTWRQEATDAAIRLIAHDRSDRAAHEGKLSEHFEFEAGPGSALYYSYATPKVPIRPALQVSLFVRSNRVGVALSGRVILPNDFDAETKQPTFLTIAGTVYEESDRWRKLEITDFPVAVERQARILRASSKRPVKIEGAYLERIIVNIHGGQGENEVFLDDLTISPVPADEVAGGRDDGPLVEEADQGAVAPRQNAESIVTLPRNRLKKEGRDWVPTIIDAPGADIKMLRDAGFDVLATPREADPLRVQNAVDNGMMLMPKLDVNDPESPLDGPSALALIRNFPHRQSVAFWNLGDDLGATPDLEDRKAELKRVREVISAIRKTSTDSSILTTGTIASLWAQYGRVPQNLDLLGASPTMWGTSAETALTLRYLAARRDLTLRGNAEALHWAVIPCKPYLQARQAVWGDDPPPDSGDPQILPEQVRLFTYAALASGYRAFQFNADAQLTRPRGQPMLTELAFLNEELDLVQSVIAQGSDPELYPTYYPDPPAVPVSASQNLRQVQRNPEAPPHPSIKVASIKTTDRRGTLLVVADYGGGSQYVPGQLAANDVVLVVPANQAAQAYEISPGGIIALERQQGPGGLKITLPLFDVTALVLVTSDTALIDKLEAAIARVRPRAVQMAIEQAQRRLEMASEVNAKLTIEGHPTKTGAELLEQSGKIIKSARERLEDADYAIAWSEARRALRPLRILMRAHWDDAFKATLKAVRVGRGQPEDPPKVKPGTRPPKEALPPVIVTGVSCPPLLSYNTLPQQYMWIEYIRSAQFGPTLVDGGDFSDLKTLTDHGWNLNAGHDFEGISSKVEIDTIQAEHESGVLKLSVDAEVKGTIDDLPPVLEQPVAAVETAPITPEIPILPGQFVRITVQVKMPRPVSDGIGGLIIRDSWGGEPMQFAFCSLLTDWREIVLFRRCPGPEPLTITLGLAGYGAVYFDELKVERIEDPSVRETRPGGSGGVARTRPSAAGVPSASRPISPPRQ